MEIDAPVPADLLSFWRARDRDPGPAQDAAGEAAAALAAAHRQMVYRIAYSVLRNHADAEDAAQEAFLRVVRTASKLAEISNAKAWVARIAWNAALDARRAQNAAPPAWRQVSTSDLARGVEELRAAGRTPEEIAATSQMLALLAQLIQGLPEKLRDAITLATVEELGYSEIAVVLKTSEAAVRARVFQARQMLREKLDRLVTSREGGRP